MKGKDLKFKVGDHVEFEFEARDHDERHLPGPVTETYKRGFHPLKVPKSTGVVVGGTFAPTGKLWFNGHGWTFEGTGAEFFYLVRRGFTNKAVRVYPRHLTRAPIRDLPFRHANRRKIHEGLLEFYREAGREHARTMKRDSKGRFLPINGGGE